MGWFESNTPGAVIGDDALDITYDFLKNLSGTYQKALQRKPTLDELRVLIETELKVCGSDFLADLEERGVTQVTVKTGKKPKDQPYKVGDVFAAPVDEGRYAFGRVMMIKKNVGMLVEFFRAASQNKAIGPDVVKSGRLFPPIRMAGGDESLKPWRWVVVDSNPSYELSEEDAKIEFSAIDPRGGFRAFDIHGEVTRKLSEEQARQLENNHFWRVHKLEERIREELQRQGLLPS